MEERIVETIVIVVQQMPQHPYLSLIFDREMLGALRAPAFSNLATEVFAQITSLPLIEICPALAAEEIEVSEILSRFALSMMMFPGRYARDHDGMRQLISRRVLPGLIPE